MKKKIATLFSIGILLAYQSCTYDKGSTTVPTSNCDTLNTISYSAQVVPILQQNCYSCHLSASTGGGILLGTHTQAKAVAQGSRFVGAIKQLSGFSAMPKGGSKLTDCQIAILQKWINQGCLNN